MEAVAILEAQEDARKADQSVALLSSRRDVLERDPNAPVLGNVDGDVTIVEFFDYNCPYCKRVKPEIQALMAADPDIRLVCREWPILGEGSVFAARAALAARNQGKYEEFHWAMMGLQGRAEEASILNAAVEIGLDADKLRADMDAPEINEHIQTSMELAAALGFNGTPSFVIGEALVPGFIKTVQFEGYVEGAREAEK
jgi:protein-disulfide isomerase|tara:strand:+ start:1327 stop:1923 length:597 start_codon:yes stop_codon:yes gene_type:complete